MVATLLRRQLDEKAWKITIIDRDWQHHYQPGWLFIPFGIYSAEDCVKPKSDFIPKGVDFVLEEIQVIDPKQRLIKANRSLQLRLAGGCNRCRIADEIDGAMEDWLTTFMTLQPEGPWLHKN
jgi:sulfide:quinone oxidoreductase